MSNFNFNKVILGGRLTADPELKATPSGASVCSFSLAVSRKYSKEGIQQVDFLKCIAWNQTAEFISKFFGKGSSICVVGSVQTRTWKDKNDQTRHETEIIIDEAVFVDSKNDVQGTFDAMGYKEPNPTFTKPVQPNFEAVNVDDTLPF
jgi:single-strand DNA-binding protein